MVLHVFAHVECLLPSNVRKVKIRGRGQSMLELDRAEGFFGAPHMEQRLFGGTNYTLSKDAELHDCQADCLVSSALLYCYQTNLVGTQSWLSQRFELTSSSGALMIRRPMMPEILVESTWYECNATKSHQANAASMHT